MRMVAEVGLSLIAKMTCTDDCSLSGFASIICMIYIIGKNADVGDDGLSILLIL